MKAVDVQAMSYKEVREFMFNALPLSTCLNMCHVGDTSVEGEETFRFSSSWSGHSFCVNRYSSDDLREASSRWVAGTDWVAVALHCSPTGQELYALRARS